MPQKEDYHYFHPYHTPEPHCIPGYTGYLPGFGPHKLYQYGKTYGRMTHDIMADHPVAGGRFGRMTQHCHHGQQDEDFYVGRHENTTNELKRTKDMVPGYTGHVPRRDFFCGKNYRTECSKGIAEFEKLKDRSCENIMHHHTYVPSEDLLPRNLTFSQRLCERPELRKIPPYATFTNPMNYGQSVFEMSDLDPRKIYMPGYTGYFTGKCFDTAVTHGRGAHQDLCDLTSSKLERQVVEKRPKINDWYRCPVLFPPRPPELEGYHPPNFEVPNLVPGYAGHIPGYRDCCLGESFGRSAGTIIRNQELVTCQNLRNQ